MTAREAVSLINGAIFSAVNAGGVGKGGNIDINAGSFSLKDSAQLQFSTSGTGNARNIKITAAGDVFIDGNKDGSSSAVGSNVQYLS